jgi:hypothetical protein
MVLWGIAIGLVSALALHAVAPHEWPVMGSRASGMRASLAVLKEGGPLLLGRHGPHGAYYAVALDDDPGAYTYFPLLGHLFEGTDPVVIIGYFYVVMVAVLAAAYPVIFYALTRSLLAGLAAPIMLVVCILSMGFIDIYWIPAWGMLALLPLLYLLARDWPRLGLAALVAISLASGWLSSIRSSSGLGILVSAALVLVLRRWRWWRLAPALALLVVAYMATNTFIFTAIREHRDQRIGVKAMPDDRFSRHPLWSTAYLGLGYLRNGYGHRYEDEVAVARAQQIAPGAVVATPRFEAAIRHAYFSFVGAHPFEAVRQYAAKALVAVADTGPYLLLVLLTMPAMLLLGSRSGRRMRLRWALLTLPAMLIGFLQPMIAIPGQGYDAEFLGVLGALGIVGVCWTLMCVEGAARARVSLSLTHPGLRAAFAEAGQRRALGTSMRISAVTIAVLAVICTGGYFVRESGFRWLGTSPGPLIRYLG